MATGPGSDNQGSSTRPYLLRALHDWCTDNGFTPYIAVLVDATVQVPGEYVKNNEIVLNVGFEATSGLKLGNDFIEFKARFGGVPREIVVPVDHVVAIYARENGQGMAFPMPAGPDAVTTVPPGPAGAPTAAVTSTKPRAAAPARGLRLARQGVEGTETIPAHKPAGRPAPAAPEPPSEPPTPPAPGASRPSLKRIK
jgi:stringent starvation protein B